MAEGDVEAGWHRDWESGWHSDRLVVSSLHIDMAELGPCEDPFRISDGGTECAVVGRDGLLQVRFCGASGYTTVEIPLDPGASLVLAPDHIDWDTDAYVSQSGSFVVPWDGFYRIEGTVTCVEGDGESLSVSVLQISGRGGTGRLVSNVSGTDPCGNSVQVGQTVSLTSGLSVGVQVVNNAPVILNMTGAVSIEYRGSL